MILPLRQLGVALLLPIYLMGMQDTAGFQSRQSTTRPPVALDAEAFAPRVVSTPRIFDLEMHGQITPRVEVLQEESVPLKDRGIKTSVVGIVLSSVLWLTVYWTYTFSWPEAVLHRMAPHMWTGRAVVWVMESLLGVFAFYESFAVWRMIQRWTISNEDGISKRIFLHTVAVLSTLVLTTSVPEVYGPRDIPEIRDAAVNAAWHQNDSLTPAMIDARGLLVNILTFGTVEKGKRDQMGMLWVDQQRRAFGVSYGAFTGDTRWLPAALRHELMHLTKKQLAMNIVVQKAEDTVEQRIRAAINPTHMAQQEQKKGGPLTVDELAETGLWPWDAFRNDRVLRDADRRFIRILFSEEIEAYYEMLKFMDHERPQGQTLRQYFEEQIQPYARQKGLSVQRWTDNLRTKAPDFPNYELYLAYLYPMAVAFTPEGVNPAFETAVASRLLFSYDVFTQPLLWAEYDPKFDLEVLAATSPAARRSQRAFYTWFLSHVLHGDEVLQGRLRLSYPPLNTAA